MRMTRMVRRRRTMMFEKKMKTQWLCVCYSNQRNGTRMMMMMARRKRTKRRRLGLSLSLSLGLDWLEAIETQRKP